MSAAHKGKMDTKWVGSLVLALVGFVILFLAPRIFREEVSPVVVTLTPPAMQTAKPAVPVSPQRYLDVLNGYSKNQFSKFLSASFVDAILLERQNRAFSSKNDFIKRLSQYSAQVQTLIFMIEEGRI